MWACMLRCILGDHTLSVRALSIEDHGDNDDGHLCAL